MNEGQMYECPMCGELVTEWVDCDRCSAVACPECVLNVNTTPDPQRDKWECVQCTDKDRVAKDHNNDAREERRKGL